MLPLSTLRRLACCILFLASTTPAPAFDDIDRLLPALPAEAPASGYLFSYVAPGTSLSEAMNHNEALWFAAVDPGVAESFAHPEEASRLTGIAFARLTGLFAAGDPPASIVVLIGPPDAGSGTAAALKPRGFTESREGPAIVFARGEDNALDLDHAATESGDPFGQSMGRSTRIGILGDLIVEAPQWATFRGALNRLVGKSACPLCKSVGVLLAAVEKAAGAHASLTEAFCVTDKVFLTDAMALDLIEKAKSAVRTDKDRKLEETYRLRIGKPGFPPFSMALFADTKLEGAESLHIALLYADEATARRGAAEAAARLSQFAPWHQRLAQPRVAMNVSGGTDGFAAVISASYASDTQGAAAQEFQLWADAIALRDFGVLQGAEMGPSLQRSE